MQKQARATLAFFLILVLAAVATAEPSTAAASASASAADVDDEKKLAVIIPMRSGFTEHHWRIAVPYLSLFLWNSGKTKFDIFVVEQKVKGGNKPSQLMNRGRLLNVGFSLVQDKGYDYFAFHDPDELPTNLDLKFDYPENPLHLATCMGRYNYEPQAQDRMPVAFLMKTEDYRKINGMSNKYWGLGWEDKDLYYRIEAAGLKLDRLGDNQHGCVGKYDPVEADHTHDANDEYNEQLFNQIKGNYKDDGLSDLKYKLVATRKEEYYTRFIVKFDE